MDVLALHTKRRCTSATVAPPQARRNKRWFLQRIVDVARAESVVIYNPTVEETPDAPPMFAAKEVTETSSPFQCVEATSGFYCAGDASDSPFPRLVP
ncbi:hypothetical protein Tco_0547521 [Tanacetum coccineum]